MSDWLNCYNQSWKGVIVNESFCHPAKFSRGLIQRIYDHAKEMGWIKPGCWVLDPFGGVALGGLDAMRMGLNWVGIELEEKFVKLGEQNIALWNRQLDGWPNLGTARIVQGDSRRLKDVIDGADILISSSPYADQPINPGNVGNRMLKETWWKGHNLAAHPNQYGHTPGNLANMKEGSIDAVISRDLDTQKVLKWHEQYGKDSIEPTTFWEASKTILQQCFDLLREGGHAIWVTKAYCKKGKIVDFPGRWKALCESVGFKTVCEHRAMLVKSYGSQKTIIGEDEEIEVSRKSFFRRLHETKRPDLKIDWEMVQCMKKNA
jgi:hypothetical protein